MSFLQRLMQWLGAARSAPAPVLMTSGYRSSYQPNETLAAQAQQRADEAMREKEERHQRRMLAQRSNPVPALPGAAAPAQFGSAWAGSGFASDDAVAAGLREATALAQEKRWPDAIATLEQTHAAMLVSSVIYPAETWCKLPLYLQRAGRFEESMRAFDFLLEDLPRRARRDARIDDDTVGPDSQKARFLKGLMEHDTEVIKTKRALAERRHFQAVKKADAPRRKPAKPR